MDDEDGGAYGGETEDSDEEDDEDNMPSLPPEIKSVSLTIDADLGDIINLPCSTENAGIYERQLFIQQYNAKTTNNALLFNGIVLYQFETHTELL